MSDRTPEPGVLLSVVVPCFNEEEALPDLLAQLVPELERTAPGAWELVLVDDGSRDHTREAIQRAHAANPRVKGVYLTRNFGHQPAIFAGLVHTSGAHIGIMDADLQDPPHVLSSCYRKAIDEKLDLVYAVRQNRKASPFLKCAYWLFYRLMRRMAEYSWPLDAGDFSVFNRKVLSLMLQMPERVRVLRGMRFWVGLRQGAFPYDRPERAKGTTKYSLSKLSDLAANSIISFSNVPLRLASLVGLGMSALSLLLIVALLINRFFPKFTLFGYYIGANPGTTTIVVLLLFIGSLLFLCLGIIGEYLGVVVKEIKRRPIAIVERSDVKRAPAQDGGLVLLCPPDGENDR
jgi:polyisoprenyl-phosphate glycosyltransferase